MKRSLASAIKAANAGLITGGNLDLVGQFFTADYTAHVTGEDLALGHDGVRGILGMYLKTFPDVQIGIEILVTQKNRVAWQRTWRGTHQGRFKGFPPSGRQIVWHDMVTSRFQGELVAEEWVITDLAECLLLSRKQ